MAKMAPDNHGIAAVASAAARDALFPSPELNRRVYRTDTKVQERFDGSTWVVDPIDYANIANAPSVDASFGTNSITSIGLTYGYNAGTAEASGAAGFQRINAGTLTLADNATNYVERTYAGVVSSNTVAFTPGRIPMAKVTTFGGVQTVIEDWRTAAAPVSPSADTASFGQDASTTAGLTYGYTSGTAVVNGVLTKVIAGTVALSNNAVNYVERTYAGVVSANTTGFTSDRFPLAKVTTLSGVITLVQDWRTPAAPIAPFPLVSGEGSVVDVRYQVGDIRRYGASPSASATANTAAIRAAIVAAVAGGTFVYFYEVYVPDGTFLVTPNLSSVDETGSVKVCFQMQSNLKLQFQSRNAVLKIANSVSTAAAPVNMRMFHSNQVLSNVRFSSGTLDMNGANNHISGTNGAGVGTLSISGGAGAVTFSTSQAGILINGAVVQIGSLFYLLSGFNGTTGGVLQDPGGTPAPNTGAGTAFIHWSRNNQTHIMFSGTGAAVGLPAGTAAHCDHMTIDGTAFLNSPGTTCIGMMQSNTVGVALGTDWKLLGLYFENNGFETDDHSSVYGWTNDVLYQGCDFRGVSSTFPTSNAVAVEIHGANHRFLGNNVKSYYQGLWMSVNYTGATSGTIIAHSQFSDMRGLGVDIDRSTVTAQPITNTKIHGCYFEFNDLSTAITLKVGVQCAAIYTIDGLEMVDCTVKKTGTTVASAMCSIGAQGTAGQKHTNITVTDNKSFGTTFGTLLSTSAAAGLGRVTLEDNKHYDLTPAGAFASPTGVGFFNGATAIDTLTIKGHTIDTAAVGVSITQPVTTLNMRGNDYVNCTTNVNIAGAVTNMLGEYHALAFTPVIKCAATPITIGNGSVVGSYDIRDGEITARITLNVGSTTTFPGGTLSFTLPKVSTIAGVTYLGTARIFDLSAVKFFQGCADVVGTTQAAQMAVNNQDHATDTVPTPLGSGDIVSLQVTYR